METRAASERAAAGGGILEPGKLRRSSKTATSSAEASQRSRTSSPFGGWLSSSLGAFEHDVSLLVKVDNDEPRYSFVNPSRAPA